MPVVSECANCFWGAFVRNKSQEAALKAYTDVPKHNDPDFVPARGILRRVRGAHRGGQDPRPLLNPWLLTGTWSPHVRSQRTPSPA